MGQAVWVARRHTGREWRLAAGDFLQLVTFQTLGGALNVNDYAVYAPVFWAVMV